MKFVFNVMRMDVDCVTDVFSQGQSIQGTSTTAAMLSCCCVVLDALTSAVCACHTVLFLCACAGTGTERSMSFVAIVLG